MSTYNSIIPSLTTTAPSPRVSSKYGFISTQETLQPFLEAGYTISNAMTVRTRRSRAEMAPYRKHLIRLRPSHVTPLQGDVVPEVVLINSHDGSSAFKLLAGLFRLVCSNGLILMDAQFGGISIPHTTYKAKTALAAASEMTELALTVATKDIPKMLNTPMSYEAQLNFAASLNTPYNAAQLIQRHRHEDTDLNLWTTFNAIQENLTKGGLYRRDRAGRGRRTPRMTSITRTVKMNTTLWQAATTYLDRTF
jgi:hypothetical protein